MYTIILIFRKFENDFHHHLTFKTKFMISFFVICIMNDISKAKIYIKKANAILISASNGLSISEGYNIFANNEPFQKYFGDFQKKYGVSNILQGVLGSLPTDAHDSFIKQLHKYMVDDYQKSPVFQNLKQLIGEKDYFIVTSNADKHFQLNDFDADKIWEVEGNFFDNQMESEEWEKQKERYQQFIQKYSDQNVIQLELGIGSRNRLIKYPLMKMVESNSKWFFITLNLPQEINILNTINEMISLHLFKKF